VEDRGQEGFEKCCPSSPYAIDACVFSERERERERESLTAKFGVGGRETGERRRGTRKKHSRRRCWQVLPRLASSKLTAAGIFQPVSPRGFCCVALFEV
jgi:hypothetical protein